MGGSPRLLLAKAGSAQRRWRVRRVGSSRLGSARLRADGHAGSLVGSGPCAAGNHVAPDLRCAPAVLQAVRVGGTWALLCVEQPGIIPLSSIHVPGHRPPGGLLHLVLPGMNSTCSDLLASGSTCFLQWGRVSVSPHPFTMVASPGMRGTQVCEDLHLLL